MDGSEAHGATVLQHANIIYMNIYVCKKKNVNYKHVLHVHL